MAEYFTPQSGGSTGFSKKAGDFAVTLGDFFKGWVTEPNPETGESEFSWKRTGISALMLGVLAWAYTNMPVLFWVGMAFMAVALYAVSTHGGMSSLDGGWPRTYEANGRERQIQIPGPEIQPEYGPPLPDIKLPGGEVSSAVDPLRNVPLADTRGPQGGMADLPVRIPMQNGRDIS